MRVMRRASSPSLISISAMPDSSSSSMSFLILRISIDELLETDVDAVRSEPGGGGPDGQLVAERPQAQDDAGGDVREIRAMAERLARVDVGKMYFDEGQLHAQQRVAQGDAGVGVGARVD